MLVVSLLGSGVTLFRPLAHEAYLRGTDAYYYALQAAYWAKTGSVKIPDSTPIHRVTGALVKTGFSGESAVRLWEVFSLLLLGLLSLVLASRRLDFKNTLLWMGLSLSPSLLFTAIEFPKLFSALLLVPLWFAALQSGFHPRASAILLTLLSVLLHRAALPLALCFSAVLLLTDVKRLRFSPRSAAAVAAILFIVAIVYLGLFRDRFHWLDLNRLTFHHARPGLLALFLREGLPVVIKMETVLVLVFCGIFIWIRKKKPGASARDCLYPLALCLPALFPVGSDEVLGVGERYALLAPPLLWISMIFLSSKDEGTVRWSKAQAIALVFLATATPWIAGFRLNLSHPQRLDPDLPSFEILAREIGPLHPPMLIARKDFVFFYKFRWMQEAFPYEPEDHWDKRHIWRLSFAISPEEMRYFLPKRCGWENGLVRSLSVPDYSLVREDCWAEMRSKINEKEDPDLYRRVRESWLNPSRKRPAFLYAKHKDDIDTEFPALRRD